MTLAEQMVWAAVFAAERVKDYANYRPGFDEVDQTAMYATRASQAVDDLRRTYKTLINKHSRLYNTMGHDDLQRLRQMTYKAED